jgi:hypothetical protein
VPKQTNVLDGKRPDFGGERFALLLRRLARQERCDFRRELVEGGEDATGTSNQSGVGLVPAADLET